MKDLRIGDHVASWEGTSEIQSKRKVSEKAIVYNLKVDTYHTYYVFDGKNIYLVHNK